MPAKPTSPKPLNLLALFSWLADAGDEPNDPNAMAIATVDADGMPNVRMVLLKGLMMSVPGRGFVFFTNFEGTKGRELLAHPKAGLLFHWKSLQRQVARVRGTVTVVSDAEADAYYASRPRSAASAHGHRPSRDRSKVVLRSKRVLRSTRPSSLLKEICVRSALGRAFA